MPIIPPALDDRSFNDLVEELLARVPAHTPEWTNPREGDPGRTMIELFAWLADTLLYRANLIPERQRLAFLRLLGVQMRPAIPARGLVSLNFDDDKNTSAVSIRPLARIASPLPFETLSEITVLPITAEAYIKRDMTDAEKADAEDVITGLKAIYRIDDARPYVTSPVFPGGAMGDLDIVAASVDRCLWLALLAPKKELVEAVRQALGTNPTGGQQLLNIGVMPAIKTPALFEDIGTRARIPHVWEITGVDRLGRPEYYTLDVIADSTAGLTRRGVVRLALPAADFIAAPKNDVRRNFNAGVGDLPPRLDAPEKDDRLVAWVRLRPTAFLHSLSLSWVGVNAVEIDQRQTITARVVGQSDGSADQTMTLPAAGVEPETLQIQVEEINRGYQLWQQVDDLALYGRDAAVYTLDSEAGTIRFGSGVRGRIPATGARVRVALMRAGGGTAGNLPPGSLGEISAQSTSGGAVPKLKVVQNLPTDGGEDAETLEQAEQRIPALFRHRSRTVTADDYRQLAAITPGVRLGRVEVLPRFKPQQRRSDVPGVVSVMVLPYKDGFLPPNPRPDRPILESVHAHLDPRRPLTTEMYVIGCEYVPLGISVGVTILGEFGGGSSGVLLGGGSGVGAGLGTLPNLAGRDAVLANIRDALRRFLWPLAPGGVAGTGWALGRTVRDRELEVVVARVPGVDTVLRVNLFVPDADGGEWRMLPRLTPDAPVELALRPWQLPELLAVVVADGETPDDLRGAGNPFADEGIAVPVVPKVCN